MRPCRCQREYTASRGSSAKQGYGSEWRKKRDAHLRKHPWCEDHLAMGKQVLATDVDHLKTLRSGGADDESNYVSRCHSCHSRKTALEDGGFGRVRKAA